MAGRVYGRRRPRLPAGEATDGVHPHAAPGSPGPSRFATLAHGSLGDHMRRRTAALALASTVLGASYAAPALAANTLHQAHGQDHRPFTFAVIGDVPYGTDAEAHFPAFIAGI